MNSNKNLHARISASLLAQAQEVARLEQISIDELVSDAMEQRLNRREFEEVLAFGKRHAQARGLRPGDVARAISEERTRTQEHGQ